MSTASRVIKNTGFLYVKMGINVFISLYTTRIILESLGSSDFGIFNVVGGAIGMLGFLNSTLAYATQRFMSYAEGEGKVINKIKIFNVSITLHLFIGFITAIALYFLMPFLFETILNIDPCRVFAAKVIYFSLIISSIFTILGVPYDAVINAHENMLFYSILGVFESFLRLSVAFVCVFTTDDKLVVYGILMAFIPLLSLVLMAFYCHKNYTECILRPIKYWDNKMVKTIAFFSGWNFLTAISSLFSIQGLNLVLNHFYGTKLNAAQGVANQLSCQLSSFSSNMLKALNPVIVKNAGSNDLHAMNRVTLSGCKFSALLIMFFAVPFIIEIKYVLGIWLTVVPEWTAVFCVLQLIQTIICQLANPAATAVYAQGDIKGYAIYKSIMNILPLILTYISFMCGASPYWLYIPLIIFWAIGGDIVIIKYAEKKCFIKMSDFYRSVFLPVFYVLCSMFLIGCFPLLFLHASLVRLFLIFVLTTISMLFMVYRFGLNNIEKEFIHVVMNKFFAQRIRKN